jgi:signal transduction histidine kinase
VGLAALILSAACLIAVVSDVRWSVPAAGASMLAGRTLPRAWPAVAAFAGTIAVGVTLLIVVPSLLAQAGVFVAVWVFAGMVPWLLGVAWRQAAALLQAGWSRADQMEREQRLITEQIRLRERTRIAQDMHDTLGHELSLVALRAGALKLSPGLAETHRVAAEEVRAGLADAVDRLGEIIGVLRDTADERGESPAGATPSELVKQAAAAGMTVHLMQTGTASPTTTAMHDHAVYRVVQEALTNAAKHAPGRAVEVHIAIDAGQTMLRVVNPLKAGVSGAPRSDGWGLLGLRERVRLAGGTFTAGDRAECWEVVAQIPHAASGSGVAETNGSATEQRRHKRRVSRTAVALVVAPAFTYAALVAGISLWRHQVFSQALLTTDVYASLHVGQPRTQIAPLLPRRQIPRPSKAPAPSGVMCEYYALTSDPFDDRSGDAYRLCFRDGVLAALDTVDS